MQKRTERPPGLFAVALVALIILAVYELQILWATDSAAVLFQKPAVVQPLFVYLVLTALGVVALAASQRTLIAQPGNRARLLLWGAGMILFLFAMWMRLFFEGGAFLLGPWTQFLYACGLAALLARIANVGEARAFEGRDLLLAAFLFLYPGAVSDTRLYFPQSGVTWALVLTGLILLIGLLRLLYFAPGERLRDSLLKWRARLGVGRSLLAALAICTPLILRYGVATGFYILCPNIRFGFVLAACLAAAYLLTRERDQLITPVSFITSAGALVLVSAVTRLLLMVVADPFSTSWSEGNRLYDYSLVFAQNLYNYQGRIPDPYGTPGRYGLWGILYLIPGLPIWVHRLWNALLLALPSLTLAWLLTRKLERDELKAALFFWMAAFFIVLAPVHPPFLIAGIIVAAFTFHPSPWVRGTSLVVASVYIGLSRWTWVLTPGAWGVLADLLLFYRRRKGTVIQRLLPSAAMAILGVLPGFLLTIGNFFGFSSGELGTAQQPLLWYRLLPNPTLGPGILLLALWTTGPAVALLVYWIKSRIWKLDLLQLIAIWGALIGFLAAGIVISTKIGGGGDLHNLDMYLVTLMFVIALGWTAHSPTPSKPGTTLNAASWPIWAQALVGFLLMLPVYSFTPLHPSAAYHPWLDLPLAAESDKTLRIIRSRVEDAAQSGEVLFMDQRQLLTFGQVQRLPFVPEYEKKFMMDQALASNAAYFEPYYRDLAAKRFALIVTEPLHLALKGQDGIFAEENDLWVIWVSRPTLCFYDPVFVDREVDVMLLVPRDQPASECETYLDAGPQ